MKMQRNWGAVAGAFGLAAAFLAGPVQANDPYLTSQNSWGQGGADQWGLKRINLPAQLPTTPVVVAVIDSGIDFYHPDLNAETIWRNSGEIPDGQDNDGNGYVDDLIGWNYVDNDNTPWDHSGHGTHTAGIIAAATGNGKGIASVNPSAKIMPLKVMNFFGRGRSIQVAAAVYYAVQNGARVINMSLGSEGISEAEKRAIDYANKKGVVVVVAAGNSAVDAATFGPGGMDGVITVTSVDQNDKRPLYANYGTSVEIAAPGDDILSLRARRTDFMMVEGPPDYKPGDGVVGADKAYYRATGTSFAAPFVAGVCSLVIASNPSLTADQVKRMVLQSASDVGTPGWDYLTGYGVVDAASAMAADPSFFIESRISGAGVEQPGGKYVMRVKGTTDADAFKRAWIEIGAGENPTSWQKVVDKIKKPVKGGVLGDFGIDVLRSSPKWVIRLITEHENGKRRETRFLLNLG
ncbi:MAG: S8 family serine peptidase [Alphaproteobacteria bacterium]